MEFDRSRIYSAVNADELRAGDKVIVANTLKDLKSAVDTALYVYELTDILTESSEDRFFANDRCYLLAYLVERKENCTNCEKFKTGYCVDGWDVDAQKIFRCENYKPKTEQKAEKHYRPFRDTDELIKVWGEKIKAFCDEIPPIIKPLIWVKDKESGDIELISMFGRGEVFTREYTDLNDLFDDYTFLDGSVCGVEE